MNVWVVGSTGEEKLPACFHCRISKKRKVLLFRSSGLSLPGTQTIGIRQLTWAGTVLLLIFGGIKQSPKAARC